MFCPGCGVELEPNATFCDCGWTKPKNLGEDAGIRMLLPVGRSGWAIAAGYFGLFSLICFPAPLALIFGILAVRDMRKHPDRHGMGRAVFGIVMGVLGTVGLVFMLIALASGR